MWKYNYVLYHHLHQYCNANNLPLHKHIIMQAHIKVTKASMIFNYFYGPPRRKSRGVMLQSSLVSSVPRLREKLAGDYRLP